MSEKGGKISEGSKIARNTKREDETHGDEAK
jgi:hypothetical protein